VYLNPHTEARKDKIVLYVDSFIAVTQPLKYARHKNSKRVYVMLALSWIVSLTISSPIALGMNYTDRRRQTPELCIFYNSDFIIFSSMGSFYIPCIVMILLYWRIFSAIRERARRSAAAKRKALCGGGGGGGGGGPERPTVLENRPALQEQTNVDCRYDPRGVTGRSGDEKLNGGAVITNGGAAAFDVGRMTTTSEGDVTDNGCRTELFPQGRYAQVPRIKQGAVVDSEMTSFINHNAVYVGLPTTTTDESELEFRRFSLDCENENTHTLGDVDRGLPPHVPTRDSATTQEGTDYDPCGQIRYSSTPCRITTAVWLGDGDVSPTPSLLPAKSFLSPGLYHGGSQKSLTHSHCSGVVEGNGESRNSNTKTVIKFEFNLRKSNASKADKSSHRRERKATKTLAIVLGESRKLV